MQIIDNKELSLGLGVLNSIQIFVMNKVYTYLALKLNEWEQHRLEQEFYDNLVIKRIIFIIFNSFYSLFYIAFIDDNPANDEDENRLEAVKLQLITLFVTALVLQNTLELFPLLKQYVIKPFCAKSMLREPNMNEVIHHMNLWIIMIHMRITRCRSLLLMMMSR